MRIFSINGARANEIDTLPEHLPDGGYLWVACGRDEFESGLARLQSTLLALTGSVLVDLHVSDLLNAQLPSHHDTTSHYDLVVFRRLSARASDTPAGRAPATPLPAKPRRSGPPILRRIDTSPVGFAVFERLLLTVHPENCAIRDQYAARLLSSRAPADSGNDPRSAGARGVPTHPADMMLRIVSQIVDGYLDLRRELTTQLDHWQTELLDPRTRFSNWSALLDARLVLHQLDNTCEEQRAAMLSWTGSLKDWALPEDDGEAQREHELLLVRSRDVLEHIERVARHVNRLEHIAETAVQMHFSVQGNRANDIMRTLTAVTAIFLPLNLITGFFGMNFEFMPLIHHQAAFWWTVTLMLLVALATALVFWRKRYLARTGR